jgi:biopolymer transport protein ExbD
MQVHPITLNYVLRVILIVFSIALIGCSQSQKKTIIVALDISSTGVYSISEKPITLEELKAKVLAIKATGDIPVIDVDTSAKPSFEVLANVVKVGLDTGVNVTYAATQKLK